MRNELLDIGMIERRIALRRHQCSVHEPRIEIDARLKRRQEMASRGAEVTQLTINISSQRVQVPVGIAACDRLFAKLRGQWLPLALADELGATQGCIRPVAQLPARGCHDRTSAFEQTLALQKYCKQRRCFDVIRPVPEDFFQKRTRGIDLAVLPERLRRTKARVVVVADIGWHRSNTKIPDRVVQHLPDASLKTKAARLAPRGNGASMAT